MSLPLSSGNDTDPKRATANVVVALSPSQVPPPLPFELRDHVSPNIWAIRVSALVQLTSQYCRPTFERAYLVLLLVLSFLVPITAYYLTLETLQNTDPNPDPNPGPDPNNLDTEVWPARSIAFGITLAMWILLSVPVVIWKYLGKVRVSRLAEQWTQTDALSAPSYGSAPVWKACMPGLFKDAVVLMVTVPLIKKSHFDRDSNLPPYIAPGDDALPPYRHSNTISWSKDLGGAIRYGELPIYHDDKANVV